MWQWLLQQYWKVYEWFGWLYNRGRAAALYAYSWAVGQALYYYGRARAWAQPRIDAARNYARWLYNSAVSLIYNLQALVWQKYYAVINWVNANIWPWIYAGTAWLTSYIDNIKALIYQRIAMVWFEINIIRLKIISEVNKLIAWIDQLQASIGEIQSFLSSDTMQRIINMVYDIPDALVVFISNPLGFIMAYLRPIFVSLFCYAMAYALGTTKYQLPSWPEWGTLAGGNGVPPDPGPPPGAGGLSPPLENMYVSGYRFGPGHWATDYGLAMDQPVYACHDGVVELVRIAATGYGHQVTVKGADWWSRYAHLANIFVSVGDQVSASQALAGGNSTGNSTGPHLHLELKFHGSFVNPEHYF